MPLRRVSPHMDGEVSQGRKTTFRRLLQDRDMLEEVEEGFANFSTATRRFGGYEVLRDSGVKKPYAWWATYTATCPILQKLALRIISQVSSSSSCERNWSTYMIWELVQFQEE